MSNVPLGWFRREWPQIYRRGSVVFGYCRLFCFLFCFAHIYETGIQMPGRGILFFELHCFFLGSNCLLMFALG